MNNLNEKLLEAVKLNEIEEVKMLIEAGADVNVVDNNYKMEDIINKILVNNYRIEIEKCLTIPNLVKITALGKDINCFLYNLNVSFEEQKDDCKLAIEKLSQKK